MLLCNKKSYPYSSPAVSNLECRFFSPFHSCSRMIIFQKNAFALFPLCHLVPPSTGIQLMRRGVRQHLIYCLSLLFIRCISSSYFLTYCSHSPAAPTRSTSFRSNAAGAPSGRKSATFKDRSRPDNTRRDRSDHQAHFINQIPPEERSVGDPASGEHEPFDSKLFLQLAKRQAASPIPAFPQKYRRHPIFAGRRGRPALPGPSAPQSHVPSAAFSLDISAVPAQDPFRIQGYNIIRHIRGCFIIRHSLFRARAGKRGHKSVRISLGHGGRSIEGRITCIVPSQFSIFLQAFRSLGKAIKPPSIFPSIELRI